MERETKIESQRARFLVHLLAKGNIEQACKVSRIGKQKAYQWLREPAFQAELRRRRTEMVDSALELLQAASVEAVQRLRELLHCGKPGTEARAAIAIIESSLKARELTDFEQRLTALEAIERENNEEHKHNGQAN